MLALKPPFSFLLCLLLELFFFRRGPFTDEYRDIFAAFDKAARAVRRLGLAADTPVSVDIEEHARGTVPTRSRMPLFLSFAF